MFAIQCPECDSITRVSLAESTYEGPFRCWKCKRGFLIKVQNEELKSCELIREEELQKYVDGEANGLS